MIVVIGHYPEYLQLGQDMTASVFTIPQDIWDRLDDAERWMLNRAFLDDAISQSARFVLATPPERIRSGSFLERELAYLFTMGYNAQRFGDDWEMVK